MRTVSEPRENVHISYDQTPKMYHRVVAKVVSRYVGEGGRVLDIGCGVGHTLNFLNSIRPDLRLSAADIDAETLASTGEKVDLEHAIEIGDFTDIVRRGERYDAVILSHVLEHTINPLEIVKQLHCIGTDSSVAVLAVPNPIRPAVMLASLFRKHYVNRGHVYAWDRSHWRNFLENIAGLEVLEHTQDHIRIPFVRRFLPLGIVERILARIFPWFSHSHISVIRLRSR